MKCEEKREQATREFLLDLALTEKLAECKRKESVNDRGKPTQVSQPRPYQSDVQVGQIRLMPDSSEIAYVAVVSRWDFCSYLVVPFSTHDGPGTDTELKLRDYDGGMSLNTVQVWNARTWHAQTLARSWLVGTLPETDLADIRALWSYSVGGSRPSADVMSRTALPIVSVDDPRLDYKTQAMAVFAPVDRIDDAVEVPVLQTIFEEEDYRLAAGERRAPDIRRKDCRIKGFDGLVRLVHNRSRRQLEIKAYGKDGAPSAKLDGWLLVTYDGVELGRMADGRIFCREVADFDCVCCLVDAEGKIRVLIPAKTK